MRVLSVGDSPGYRDRRAPHPPFPWGGVTDVTGVTSPPLVTTVTAVTGILRRQTGRGVSPPRHPRNAPGDLLLEGFQVYSLRLTGEVRGVEWETLVDGLPLRFRQ